VGSTSDGILWGDKRTLDWATTPASDGPALAPYVNAFNDPGPGLAIAWTGTDNRLNVAYSTNDPTDRNFGSPQTFDNTSPYGPGLAEDPGLGGDLDIAYTTSSGHHVAVIDLFLGHGHMFNFWTTNNAPSLVSSRSSGTLYAGFTGTDGRLNV